MMECCIKNDGFCIKYDGLNANIKEMLGFEVEGPTGEAYVA